MEAVNQQAINQTRTYVSKSLICKVKTKYPETMGMKNTQVMDWALRKLISKKEA